MQYDELMIRRAELRRIMQEYRQALDTKIGILQKVIAKCPEGKIRAVFRRRRNQYYWVREDTDGYGEYISLKKSRLLHQLTTKRFSHDLIELYLAELQFIERFLTQTEGLDILKLIGRYGRGFQNAIANYLTLPPNSDAEFTAWWQSQEYQGLEFDSSDETKYYSIKNERMRSRAEVIIANALTTAGIPYRYECQLHLNHSTVYPDFICLNTRLRKEFVWEHLGMMDQPSYRKRNLAKLSDYMQSGYIQGQNLIVTMDGGEDTFDTRSIHIMINTFLL